MDINQITALLITVGIAVYLLDARLIGTTYNYIVFHAR